MSEMKYLDMDGLAVLWTKFKKKFVEKNGEKGLSDNNYTDEAKAKVATISPISSSVIDKIFDE